MQIVTKPEGLQGLRSPAPPVGGRAHLRLADALPPAHPRRPTAACRLRSVHQVGDDRDHDPTARPTIMPPSLATKPARNPLLKHVLSTITPNSAQLRKMPAWFGGGPRGKRTCFAGTSPRGLPGDTPQAHIDDLGPGYVTSLPPSDHPELLAVAHRKFEPVDVERYPGVSAHDTTVEALGVTRRAIITHSVHQRQACGCRTDSRQSAPAAGGSAGPARTWPHPQVGSGHPDRDRQDPRPPLAQPGHHRDVDRRHPQTAAAALAHNTPGPPDPGSRTIRQEDPVHQP